MTETVGSDYDFSEFLEWKESRTTQRVYAYLQQMRTFYLARLLQAPLTDLGDTGKVIGTLNAIDEFLTLDFKALTQREDT